MSFVSVITWFPSGRKTYACPHCIAEITPPGDDLFQEFTCPNCGQNVVFISDNTVSQEWVAPQ